MGRITRNIAINVFKERNTQKRSALICELSQEMEQCIPSSSNADNYIDSVALTNSINKFLDSIDEEKRNIFIRRYWFMDTVESISVKYGVSKSKVKSTLFRIRKQLREFLEKEGYNL